MDGMASITISKIIAAVVWCRKAIPVIARSWVTFAVAVQTALVAFAASVGDTWPVGARWALVAAAGLLVSVRVIRRVTPVDKDQRSVL